MPDRIEAFIEAVAAEIRWKKARPVLMEEIRTHLLDQRDAYAAQDLTEDAAQAEAVRQMGDPVALGTDLDRIHRPRPQWGLLALALAAAACCLCPSVYALVLMTMAGLVLGLFFALRDWLGLGRKKSVLLVLALGLGVLAAIVAARWEHLRYSLFADLGPTNQGYFAFILREALAGARWIGPAELPAWAAEEGLTFRQAVPEMDSDALLVNLICTWGWLPFLALVGMFLAFFLWLLWKTLRLRQTLGRAVCLAAVTTLAVQAMAGLTLTLGVPVLTGGFPLVVSNTNTVLALFLVGLALSALRSGSLPERAPAPCRKGSVFLRRIRWENGELILSLRPKQG